MDLEGYRVERKLLGATRTMAGEAVCLENKKRSMAMNRDSESLVYRMEGRIQDGTAKDDKSQCWHR